MSPSRLVRAAMYEGLPPLTPPISLYCCQRSVSMISAAARNLKIATSPELSLETTLRGLAAGPAALTPAARRPHVGSSAPAPPSPLRKARRRTTLFQRARRSSLSSSTVHSFCAWSDVATVSRFLKTAAAGLAAGHLIRGAVTNICVTQMRSCGCYDQFALEVGRVQLRSEGPPVLSVIRGLTYIEQCQVFNRWFLPTYQTSFRWTGNRSDAEDATSWVFMKAIGHVRLGRESRGGGRGRSRLSSRVCHRRCGW